MKQHKIKFDSSYSPLQNHNLRGDFDSMAKANAAGGVTLRSNSVSEFSQENTNNSPVNKQAKRKLELKLPVSKIFFKTQN